MEIFKELKNKNTNYSEKINRNKYTQDISKKVDLELKKYDEKLYFKSIYELILSIKDNQYQILENSEKEKYTSDKKIVLCSKVDDEYNTYNYNKRVLSKSLICANLQKNKDNLLSLILFYNDYFKINLILCHDNKYYKSGIKDYNNIYIEHTKNGWIIKDINFSYDIEHLNILELKYGIELDLKTNFIYNSYLKAISNYKSDELIDIAKELNIDLMKNGKKKVKKELYDEINLQKL
jgi:hypothetical protein